MTPQEKAKELFLKYAMYIRAGYMFDEEADEDAKQCALIAIDLAIEIETGIFKGKVYKSYWNEVKAEIEKI